MEKIRINKTFNFNKYSINLNTLFANWKFWIPLIMSLIGIFWGSVIAKGEGLLYSKLNKCITLFINFDSEEMYTDLIIYLLIPTIFAFVIFFSGLTVYGGFFVSLIPMSFSMLISMIIYYFYSLYKLKGLAFIVIMILPYSVLSLFSLILLTVESMSMSNLITRTLSKSNRINNYNFGNYYKNSIKHYIFIIIASLVKVALDKLFVGLFSF